MISALDGPGNLSTKRKDMEEPTLRITSDKLLVIRALTQENHDDGRDNAPLMVDYNAGYSSRMQSSMIIFQFLQQKQVPPVRSPKGGVGAVESSRDFTSQALRSVGLEEMGGPSLKVSPGC